MSAHLPECRHASHTHAPDPWCDCKILRACEQRVVAMRKDNGELWLDGYGTGFQDGHTFALDAAWEAVAAIPAPRYCDEDWNNAIHEVLAVIDALREEKP